MPLATLCSMLLAGAAPTATPPAATVDLATSAGLRSVSGEWRYRDAEIVPTPFVRAGGDGQPGTDAITTHDIFPKAGARDFDDSGWPVIPGESLSQRRGGGLLSFNWYRLKLTLPDKIGGVDVTHAAVVFRTCLDDYAEVWADGEMARAPGSAIAGWNALNRMIVARDAHPGQVINLAVFGANGPISSAPNNYIWMREAGLEIYPSASEPDPVATGREEVNVDVIRFDPALDRLLPVNTKLFKLAEGFKFTEGPVWSGSALLFSDPNANGIYRYAPDGSLAIFREKSGYDGADIGEYRQPGSNGITLDPQGHLIFDQHGKRRVVRLDGGTETVLADRYQGKRLNSPNDLVTRSDGTVYFTDPVFGLPRLVDDPRRELSIAGVYRIRAGRTELLTAELNGPNGIAFSPDERFLYVGNWDEHSKVVMRYPVRRDGSIGSSTLFADLTAEPGEDAIDGIKVDTLGNVYASGPGGLWIFAPDGRRLGLVKAPRHPHNMAWGGAGGKSLFLAAQDRLYEMPMLIEGIRPFSR